MLLSRVIFEIFALDGIILCEHVLEGLNKYIDIGIVYKALFFLLESWAIVL